MTEEKKATQEKPEITEEQQKKIDEEFARYLEVLKDPNVVKMTLFWDKTTGRIWFRTSSVKFAYSPIGIKMTEMVGAMIVNKMQENMQKEFEKSSENKLDIDHQLPEGYKNRAERRREKRDKTKN